MISYLFNRSNTVNSYTFWFILECSHWKFLKTCFCWTLFHQEGLGHISSHFWFLFPIFQHTNTTPTDFPNHQHPSYYLFPHFSPFFLWDHAMPFHFTLHSRLEQRRPAPNYVRFWRSVLSPERPMLYLLFIIFHNPFLTWYHIHILSESFRMSHLTILVIYWKTSYQTITTS